MPSNLAGMGTGVLAKDLVIFVQSSSNSGSEYDNWNSSLVLSSGKGSKRTFLGDIPLDTAIPTPSPV